MNTDIITQTPAGQMVTMICDTIPDFPEPVFPAGYGIRLMTEADIPVWLDIQRDAEPYFETPDDLFIKQFGPDLTEAWSRCYLLTGPEGEGVGVIAHGKTLPSASNRTDSYTGWPSGPPTNAKDWPAQHQFSYCAGLKKNKDVRT